jgi:biopolymer transport protein ExbD
MRSTRHEPESGDEHGIDLAPMLDFVLNLLIFFIITTSFVREPGINVTKEEAMTASARESGNILIALRANDEIWMDRRQVELREVRPLIERMHVERPEDTVIVIADKAARTGMLAQVMDEVALGGIEEIAIGAQTPGGE